MVKTEIAEANPLFGVETHGYDHIPDSDRQMKMRDVGFFWVGTNANLFFVSVGAISVTLGLNVWQALLACLIGNALFLLVGIASVAGVRAGLPAMTFTRAVFGVLGNRPQALLAWVSSVAFEAINTIFGVYATIALMRLLGWHHPGTPGQLIAVALQLGIGGGLAVLGHATMVWFQRVFAVLLGIALLLVLVFALPRLHWTNAAPKSDLGTAAALLVGCAIISSGPISYLYNAPDWVRYLPAKTRSSQIVTTVTLYSGLPALLLAGMGAVLASNGDMSDPVAGVKTFVPLWVFITYTVAAAGGSIANNVVTYYSSGLAIQSIGVPLHRYVATALDTILSTGIVLYILFVQDFTTALNDFVAMLVVWLGPFAGVWMTDGLLRRWRYDPVAAHGAALKERGAYWYQGGVNVRGWIALLVGVGCALLTVNSPVFTGPIASAMGGADLSWLAGIAGGCVAYLLLAGRSVRTEGAAASVGYPPVRPVEAKP